MKQCELRNMYVNSVANSYYLCLLHSQHDDVDLLGMFVVSSSNSNNNFTGEIDSHNNNQWTTLVVYYCAIMIC